MTDRSRRSSSAPLALATKATRRLSLYATLATHRVLGVFGHRDYVPFIVLTRSRTGSNLLLSFLNSHPNVFCEGEIFAKLNGADPLRKLERTFGKQPHHIHAKGFKIFYYHPLDAEATAFWAELERRTDIRIIHLTRENILRTLVSRKIAGIKGSWTGTSFDKSDSHDKSVILTADELEEGFLQTQAWEDSAERQFNRHPILRMTYEQITTAPAASYQALSDFLGIPDSVPRTNLHRQNPEHMQHLIRNYDELKVRFSGTCWSRFFDD